MSISTTVFYKADSHPSPDRTDRSAQIFQRTSSTGFGTQKKFVKYVSPKHKRKRPSVGPQIPRSFLSIGTGNFFRGSSNGFPSSSTNTRCYTGAILPEIKQIKTTPAKDSASGTHSLLNNQRIKMEKEPQKGKTSPFRIYKPAPLINRKSIQRLSTAPNEAIMGSPQHQSKNESARKVEPLKDPSLVPTGVQVNWVEIQSPPGKDKPFFLRTQGGWQNASSGGILLDQQMDKEVATATEEDRIVGSGIQTFDSPSAILQQATDSKPSASRKQTPSGSLTLYSFGMTNNIFSPKQTKRPLQFAPQVKKSPVPRFQRQSPDALEIIKSRHSKRIERLNAARFHSMMGYYPATAPASGTDSEQKISRLLSQLKTKGSSSQLHHKIVELLSAWRKFSIPKHHQAQFLARLYFFGDESGSKSRIIQDRLQRMVTEETELTLKGHSLVQEIEAAIRDRERIKSEIEACDRYARFEKGRGSMAPSDLQEEGQFEFEMTTLLKTLRSISIIIVRLISQWRSEFYTGVSSRVPYMWKGKNYLHFMQTDTSFYESLYFARQFEFSRKKDSDPFFIPSDSNVRRALNLKQQAGSSRSSALATRSSSNAPNRFVQIVDDLHRLTLPTDPKEEEDIYLASVYLQGEKPAFLKDAPKVEEALDDVVDMFQQL